MSGQLEQDQERPIVVYAVQTVSILTSVSYALEAVGTLAKFDELSVLTVLRTVAICLVISGFSLSVWRGVGKRRSIGRRYVLNYLWFMVLVYPVMTIMRSLGMFAPAPHLEDTELFGAALAELTRYGIFLGLIIWAGLSSEFKKYLSTAPG